MRPISAVRLNQCLWSSPILNHLESALVLAVALALMAGRALAAESEPEILEGFGELMRSLDTLSRSWAAHVDYDPNGWNGVWPTSPFERGGILIYHDPGGVIKEHVERWQELARSGADVEILGPCYSACTLILAYVPKERLCFGAFASLQFHLAWYRETGKPSLD